MKKSLALLLALLLAMSSFAFAEEGTEKEKELFDIWDYGSESMTWVCSAIPVTDGAVLVSPALLPEKQDQLAVTDGKNVWEARAVVPDESGLTALVLFDTEKAAARYEGWDLLPYGISTPVSSCYVRTGDEMGSRINRRVLSSEDIQWQGCRCLMLTLSDPVPPGSPVLTTEGNLAGLVVAEYAEGNNRFIALPADEIALKLTEISGKLNNMPGWSDPPEGFKVTADKNLVTVDWTEMTLPEKGEGETVYLVLLDGANSYLNYYPAEVEQRKMKFILTPGRFYIIGIGAYSSAPAEAPARYETISIPAAGKLTANGFRPILTAIAESEEKTLKDGETPVPVTEVTEELLRSGRAWFYSSSCYEVTERIENITLLVTLTDPNGINYRYESGWLYDPSYMNEDTWYINLQEYGLTNSLDEGGYPKGVYTVAYYVGGDPADSFTFELK